MIVDRAIDRDGERIAAPESLAGLNAACRGGDEIAWIGLHRPDAAEFAAVAEHFDLRALAVDDAVKARQRPKLERFFAPTLIGTIYGMNFRNMPELRWTGVRGASGNRLPRAGCRDAVPHPRSLPTVGCSSERCCRQPRRKMDWCTSKLGAVRHAHSWASFQPVATISA